MVVVNLVIPVAVLSFQRGRRPLPTALVGCGVLVGMWLERFLIVVPALSTPRLAYSIGDYMPSWVELGIMIGAVGVFACLYFTFTQLLPIVSVWEMREGWRHAASGEAGGATSDAAPTSGTGGGTGTRRRRGIDGVRRAASGRSGLRAGRGPARGRGRRARVGHRGFPGRGYAARRRWKKANCRCRSPSPGFSCSPLPAPSSAA